MDFNDFVRKLGNEESKPGNEGNELNINTAGEEKLAQVPGIGPERAQKIVQSRPFNDWDDLKQKVEGISDSMIDTLKQAGATVG
jgi:competence ComEA-like helix-hairpin-helix protein